jgi:hypothetical protein
MSTSFERLIADAEADIEANRAWQFDYVKGRRHWESPPWSYEDIVLPAVANVETMLDMDTGGGELLRSLHDRAPRWPARVAATESYLPSLEIAKRNLMPLGIEVIHHEDRRRLPLPDSSFDLVINRHGGYKVPELQRILKDGGLFITQQVGSDMCAKLNSLLGVQKDPEPRWDMTKASSDLTKNGFRLLDKREYHGHDIFDDIGAVAWYLLKVPWQIPDFTINAYRDRLRILHAQIASTGPIDFGNHHFFVIARRVADGTAD